MEVQLHEFLSSADAEWSVSRSGHYPRGKSLASNLILRMHGHYSLYG
jgi:hypothetical protein